MSPTRRRFLLRTAIHVRLRGDVWHLEHRQRTRATYFLITDDEQLNVRMHPVFWEAIMDEISADLAGSPPGPLRNGLGWKRSQPRRRREQRRSDDKGTVAP